MTHTHPYQLFIFVAGHGTASAGWNEPYAAASERDAVYIAGLIYRDSRAVVKVVRFGHNLLCLPDAHAVGLCERQIAKQQERENERPFSPD